MDQTALDTLRRRLDEEHDAIVAQLTDMGVDPETGAPSSVEFAQGFADSGQATAEKARVLAIAEGLVEQLHEVEGAQQRIRDGSYGKCSSCGSDIPVERLDARPVATLCMSCKQRLG